MPIKKSIKSAPLSAPSAPAVSAPVKAPIMTIETVKVEFVAGLKSFYTAKERLSAAFKSAVTLIVGDKPTKENKVKLRETLIAWGVEAGLNKKTVSNTVSGLMLAADLSLRKRGKVKSTEDQKALAAELVEWLSEHLEGDDVESEMVQILRLAMQNVKDAE